MFSIINDHTKDYLRKERNFFSRYTAERTDDVVESIDKLLETIPHDNSFCILKMSVGSGFHSITGDWQFKDYNDTGYQSGKKKYKSRKVVEYDGKLQLMGFVKISQLSDEISKKKLEDKERIRQDHIDNSIRNINDRKYQLELIKKERLEQAIIKEKERQRLLTYQQLIEEASSFFNENKYKEALDKAQKAKEIYPNGKKHEQIFEKIEKWIKILEDNKKEEETRQKHLSQPLKEVLKGKTSSVGNIIGYTRKWLKQGNNSMGETEIKSLFEALSSLPKKEIKKIKGKQKDLTSIIGEDYTNKLFNILNLT